MLAHAAMRVVSVPAESIRPGTRKGDGGTETYGLWPMADVPKVSQ